MDPIWLCKLTSQIWSKSHGESLSENDQPFGGMSIWLVLEPQPSEKYDESSVGMMTFPYTVYDMD